MLILSDIITIVPIGFFMKIFSLSIAVLTALSDRQSQNFPKKFECSVGEMSSNLLETSLVTAQIFFVGSLQLFHIVAARVRVKYNFFLP